MNRIKQILLRQLNSKIGNSAAWMIQGQAIQLVAQFGYFVLIARVLGPAGFGTFVAATAVVLALAPFSPIGSGQVMMRNAARDRSLLPVYFGNCILITIAAGLVWTVILQGLRIFLLPSSVSAGMLLCVALSDLIFTQTTSNCSLAFLALDRPKQAASATLSGSALRFVASLMLLAFHPSPALWARFYLGAAALAAIYQVWAVARASSRPTIDLARIPSSLREGFYFAVSLTSATLYDNIDKTQLARMSNVESAAIYAVAYRFVDAACLPIRGLAASTYAEYFRRGVGGIPGTWDFAKKILRRSVPYGLFASVALFVCAGLVPLVMGPRYAQSAEALRWLSPLPLIKSFHSFFVDVFTGADRQALRSVVQAGVAIFNIGINFWLIAKFSWRGAAWSSLLSDSLLMVALYLLIQWHLRKPSTNPAISGS